MPCMKAVGNICCPVHRTIVGSVTSIDVTPAAAAGAYLPNIRANTGALNVRALLFVL